MRERVTVTIYSAHSLITHRPSPSISLIIPFVVLLGELLISEPIECVEILLFVHQLLEELLPELEEHISGQQRIGPGLVIPAHSVHSERIGQRLQSAPFDTVHVPKEDL